MKTIRKNNNHTNLFPLLCLLFCKNNLNLRIKTEPITAETDAMVHIRLLGTHIHIWTRNYILYTILKIIWISVFNTERVTVGADATIYVWFVVYVNKRDLDYFWESLVWLSKIILLKYFFNYCISVSNQWLLFLDKRVSGLSYINPKAKLYNIFMKF